MAKTTRKQYVIVYRMGGTRNFRWQRSLSLDSYDAAIEKRNDVERMGYPAHVVDLGLSMAFGLPDTFTYEAS
jgi:hypothetical protein